ncbi:DJ-1/PfpI family protein [Amycolatopsis sp. CA-230715]|uniref:DJ-1/PfpI family protein n=1 Tax=Amycolatopsis sp. CA-230715 TaxID=2745196 RepID=UPI001C0225FE|nr:DJ-1/PfpI family protein [Amycolatopsis sp. CA-230715]QWF76827.1 Isonitrile hydratase [Amycolatopsis sp. CA-230715]
MRVAILLYDRFTALDVVGPYEMLCRLPGAEVVFTAERTGPVRNDADSLTLVAEASLGEVEAPDIVLVPGGPDTRGPAGDGPVRDWLRAVDATTTWTTSVCTGSLILGAAGLLRGRRATSHWIALDRLPSFGAVPVSERVVTDGKYVTAAGVSAGIDMALTLAGEIAGAEVAQRIQLGAEYAPEPPYDAGRPDTAPAEIVAGLRAMSAQILQG